MILQVVICLYIYLKEIRLVLNLEFLGIGDYTKSKKPVRGIWVLHLVKGDSLS